MKITILLIIAIPVLSGSSISSVVITDVNPVERITATPKAESVLIEWSGDISKLAIIGTWINMDYNKDGRSARIDYVANSDGTISYTAYDKVDGSGNVYQGTIKYIERWTDSEGRQYGRSIVTLAIGMSWETLDRISADGTTLEVQSGVSEIDPQGPRYSVYYRE